MNLLTRQEYNLILRSFDSYNYLMTNKEKELRETLEDKLYYNFYNPRNKVTQTNTELPDLDNKVKSLNFRH